MPGRTVTDMSDEVVLRLGENPNIAGLKDATGDLARGISLLRAVPPDFAVYSGDDATAASLILHGARGNISVTANVVPAMMSLLCAAALCGDVATVRKHSYRMAPLNETMFVESNPIPVKFALAHLGYIAEHYRLPLTPLGQSCRQGVIDTLQLAMEREDE